MNTLSQPINNRLNRNPPISQPRANPPILRRNVVMKRQCSSILERNGSRWSAADMQ